jgi:ATP-binding cassette subfamily B protein
MARDRPLAESLPSLARTLVRLRPYLARRRGVLLSSLVSMFAAVGLRLLEPWPLKLVFDEVLGPALGIASGAGLAALELHRDVLLLGICAVLVLVTALRAGAQYLNRVGFAKLGNGVVGELRQDLFRHLQDLPLSFHDKARTGDTVVRVINDVNLLRDVAVTAVLPLTASLLTLAGMWGLMLWLDWRLTLMAAAVLPLVALRGFSLSRRIQGAARKQRARQSDLATSAVESMGSIKNVQALALEGDFLDRFGARSASSLAQDVKTARLSASLGRTVDVLLALATALVLGFGARQAMAGVVTPGELLIFLTYLRRAFNPVQDLAKYAGRLAKASAAGERVLELLEREAEIVDAPGAVVAPRLRGEIGFEAVHFEYEEGRSVLTGLDLEVEAGKRFALVGPSGIGKSTTLDLLLRLREPRGGRVLVDGRDVRSYTRESLRSQVAIVLQDSLLFRGTVADNIALGARSCSREEVVAAARIANAHGFIERLPQGYETEIGERGVNLSGGEKQRIAIARAAIRRAPLLLLDEPTTGLDGASRRAVVEALWRLAADHTTLLVSHDLELCSGCDEIAYLEGGRIVERGSHRDLMELGARYSRMFRLQVERRPVLLEGGHVPSESERAVVSR